MNNGKEQSDLKAYLIQVNTIGITSIKSTIASFLKPETLQPFDAREENPVVT